MSSCYGSKRIISLSLGCLSLGLSCSFVEFFGTVETSMSVGIGVEWGMVRCLTLCLGELHIPSTGGISMVHVRLESVWVGRLVVPVGCLGVKSGGDAAAGVRRLNHVHELGC